MKYKLPEIHELEEMEGKVPRWNFVDANGFGTHIAVPIELMERIVERLQWDDERHKELNEDHLRPIWLLNQILDYTPDKTEHFGDRISQASESRTEDEALIKEDRPQMTRLKKTLYNRSIGMNLTVTNTEKELLALYDALVIAKKALECRSSSSLEDQALEEINEIISP